MATAAAFRLTATAGRLTATATGMSPTAPSALITFTASATTLFAFRDPRAAREAAGVEVA